MLALLALLAVGSGSPSPAVAEAYARGHAAIVDKDLKGACDHWRAAVAMDPAFEAALNALAAHCPTLQPPTPSPTVRGNAAPGKPSATPAARQRSLGELARERGKPSESAPGKVIVLSGRASSTDSVPAIPTTAPTGLLDAMRAQAEAVFRPRMESVANVVRDFRIASRQYRDACYRKRAYRETEGEVEGTARTSGTVYDTFDALPIATYGSETRFAGRWSALTTTRNEETPACRAIASDMDAAARRIGAAMSGADDELIRPPSVYPGIREEVFARLVNELW